MNDIWTKQAKIKTPDEIACPYARINSLDWRAIKEIFEENNKKITERRAEDLGLLVEQANKVHPSYGGIILFGTNRLRLFPDAIVKCVRFLGLNKVNVLDHLEITAYPILAVDEILRFVRKNTRMGAQFGKMVRIDVPEYPDIAVREVVINALLHADYAINGASIMLAIYDDRLEVSSPGGMPLGMTLERALAGSSRVRNRVIARVFREVGLSEQWGSGLQRIVDACEKRGLETPLFQDLDREFKVTLYATAKKTRNGKPAHEEFVKYVKKQGGSVNTQKAAVFWHITPRNARVRLKKLMDAGVICRVGTSAKDPRGFYTLVDRNRK